jgi:hypothetical protein
MPTGYVDGFAVGIAYNEGKRYADGQTELRRGVSTPRAALGADGKTWLRRGQSAIGVALHSYSESAMPVMSPQQGEDMERAGHGIAPN